MISNQGKFIKEEDWEKYIGGYFIALDFTDRIFQ